MLILVRHGRTAHNASRLLAGRVDVPLDELGRRQAKALGESGLGASVERVISSPLFRARETAAAFGLPVSIDDRWIEIAYGRYEGTPVGDIPPATWESWRRDPDAAPEGGESVAAVGRRVRAACEELWGEASERDVAVVTHVSPIRAAVKWAMGLDDAVDIRVFVDNASVSRIGRGRAGGRSLFSFNETSWRPSA